MNTHPRAHERRFSAAAFGPARTGGARLTGPMPVRFVAVVALVAAAALAATDVAPAKGVARCEVKGPLRQSATRAFVLRVRAPQRIFTKAEAATAKPEHHGELIVRGALPRAARAGTRSQTHVSIHVRDRETGRVLWEPYPLRVRLRRASEQAPGRALAVALMEGVGKGVCDRHYGTNVRLEAGQRYILTATLGSDTVSFSLEAAEGHAGHGG